MKALVFSLLVTILLGTLIQGLEPRGMYSPMAAQQQGQNVELVGQIGGITQAVAVQGNYAYIGVGPRLVILNVSDPAHPAVIGQTGVLPCIVRGVAVAGNYAYVAGDYGGLRIINVSNPATPSEVSFYNTAGAALDVAIVGSYAYVADRSGLRIISVSDSVHPNEVGFYETPGQAYYVEVVGNYAYITAFSHLQIVDVADPMHPTMIGDFTEVSAFYPFGVTVVGEHAYLTEGPG